MRVVDLILVLVGSAGSIGEAMRIPAERQLCAKAGFYCFEEHKDGGVVKHLRFIAPFGATCDLMPLDRVQACHLTTVVLDKVRAVHVGNAFLL